MRGKGGGKLPLSRDFEHKRGIIGDYAELFSRFIVSLISSHGYFEGYFLIRIEHRAREDGWINELARIQICKKLTIVSCYGTLFIVSDTLYTFNEIDPLYKTLQRLLLL